ncbi:MAG: hypothetical protein ACFFD4_19285 [Candidatus Odinarchaeota archaeon]
MTVSERSENERGKKHMTAISPAKITLVRDDFPTNTEKYQVLLFFFHHRRYVFTGDDLLYHFIGSVIYFDVLRILDELVEEGILDTKPVPFNVTRKHSPRINTGYYLAHELELLFLLRAGKDFSFTRPAAGTEKQEKKSKNKNKKKPRSRFYELSDEDWEVVEANSISELEIWERQDEALATLEKRGLVTRTRSGTSTLNALNKDNPDLEKDNWYKTVTIMADLLYLLAEERLLAISGLKASIKLETGEEKEDEETGNDKSVRRPFDNSLLYPDPINPPYYDLLMIREDLDQLRKTENELLVTLEELQQSIRSAEKEQRKIEQNKRHRKKKQLAEVGQIKIVLEKRFPRLPEQLAKHPYRTTSGKKQKVTLEEVLFSKNNIFDNTTGEYREKTTKEKHGIARKIKLPTGEIIRKVIFEGYAQRVKPIRLAIAERVTTLGQEATGKCIVHVDEAIDLLRGGVVKGSGKFAVADLAANLTKLDGKKGERSNLGSSAYTFLLVACENYLINEKRLLCDIKPFFQQHHTAWYEFLLFGRSTFAESCLSRYWDVKYGFSRSLFEGIRRKFDPYLPEGLQLHQQDRPRVHFPVLSAGEFRKACTRKLRELFETIQKRKKEGKPVKKTVTFWRKVEKLYDNADQIITVLYRPLLIKGFPQPFTLGWKPLKQREQELKRLKILPKKPNYRSALRAILSLAAAEEAFTSLAEFVSFAVIPRDIGVDVMTPERCLTRPFRGKKHGNPVVKQYDELKRKHRKIITLYKQLKEEHTVRKTRLQKQKLALPATKKNAERCKQEEQVLEKLEKDYNKYKPLLQDSETRLQELRTELEKQLPVLQTYRPQPVDLLMGSDQVIFRPSNAGVMTTMLAENEVLPLTFPKCRVKGEKTFQRLTAYLPASPRMQHVLDQGAKINILRVLPPKGPKRKVTVQVIFEGLPEFFGATKHLELENYCWACKAKLPVTGKYRHCSKCGEILSRTNVTWLNQPVRSHVGLDINRMSDYMLAFSHYSEFLPDSHLSKDTLAAIDRYRNLSKTIKSIKSQIVVAEKSGDQVKASNLSRQLSLVHNKRKKLRKDVHERCSVEIGKQLVSTGALVLARETLSTGDAKGKRGGLAKAIYNMPDQLSYIIRTILNVNVFNALQGTVQRVLLDTVDPRGTSKYHTNCPYQPRGKLVRGKGHYDMAPCSACSPLDINSHTSAAQEVEKRSRNSIQLQTTISTTIHPGVSTGSIFTTYFTSNVSAFRR